MLNDYLRVIATVFLLSSSAQLGCFAMSGSRADEKAMSQSEYRHVLARQDEIHKFIRLATQHENRGDHSKALEFYLKAYEINQCAGLIAVCRGALADNYEALGENVKALEHVEWALQRINPKVPLYATTSETKIRLLKKIEEQKQWTAKQDPVVAQFKENFPKASDANQKKFLESLGGKGVWEIFKNAMVAEHDQKYAQALSVYESLIPRKAEIEKEMGIHGWVMLYPAIQRNSEALGQTEKEKSALLWIKANMLDPKGQYKETTTRLLPEVINHLKERIQVYQL